MGTLCWNDISHLSIFKCKLCSYRLQSPVMEVETFGNICGSCYETSVYINVSENTDIETILSKLYIPCKYFDRGCYFDSSFKNTSKHEKQCEFKDKLCPFNFIEDCKSTNIINVVEHIKQEHTDYFVNLSVEGRSITIENPMEIKCLKTNCDSFYLFEYQNKHFLFRIQVDVEQQKYYFSLYDFDKDDVSNKIAFHLMVEHNDLITKTKSAGALSYKKMSNKSHDNLLTISGATFINLGCTKISLNIEEAEKNLAISKILTWFKCSICKDDIINEPHICPKCINVRVCNRCYKLNSQCSECSRKFISKILEPFIMNPAVKIKCSVDGCNGLIRRDQYELHKRNCLFKMYECPYMSSGLKCKWKGLYMDISKHIKNEHVKLAFVNALSIPISSGNIYPIPIIKNYNTVHTKFELTKQGKFKLKIGVIGPTNLDNLYIWELHLRNSKDLSSIVISRLCKNFDDDENNFEEIIDASNYVIDDELKFTIRIKHRN